MVETGFQREEKDARSYLCFCPIRCLPSPVVRGEPLEPGARAGEDVSVYPEGLEAGCHGAPRRLRRLISNEFQRPGLDLCLSIGRLEV